MYPRYFGFEFAHGASVVTIAQRDGACFAKGDVWPMPKLWRFSIQDPFDHTHDLGTVLSEQSWQAIHEALRQTAKTLQLGGDIAALVLANPSQVGRASAGAAACPATTSLVDTPDAFPHEIVDRKKVAKQQNTRLNRKQKRAEARLQRAEATAGVVRPEAQLSDLRTTLSAKQAPAARKAGRPLPDLRTTISSGGAAGGAAPSQMAVDRKVLLKRLKSDKKRLRRCKKLQAKPLGDLSSQERKIVASFAKLERKVKARSAELDAFQ